MMGCERYTQNREIHVRIHHLLACHTRQQHHLQDICRTYPTRLDINGVDGQEGYLRARIAISDDLWQVGRGDLSACQLMPIDFAEPFMGKHVPGAVP